MSNQWKLLAKLLLSLICFFSVVDTKLFIYSSLSYSMLGVLSSLFLFFAVCIYGHVSSKNIGKVFDWRFFDGKGAVFLCIIYVFLFHLLKECENYRVYYILGYLLLCLTIYASLKFQLFDSLFIERLIIILLAINILYVYFQLFGILQSNSVYFKVSGITENPSVSSIFIAGSSFVLIDRIIKNKNKVSTFYYLGLCFVLLYAIIILRCRTAIVGFILNFLIILFFKGKYHKISYLSIFLSAIVVVVFLGLLFKLDSTSGRLLIWKISMSLIRANIFGYGYGTFERNYNLAQSEYFGETNRPMSEIMNADYVFMPYNDLMEHTIDGGILGAIIYVSFWCVLLYTSIKLNKIKYFSALFSLFVMSMINFVYTSVECMLLISCIVGNVCYESSKNASFSNMDKLKQFKGKINIFLLVALASFLMQKECMMIKGQYKLNRILSGIKEGFFPDEYEYNDILNGINTSEAFYREYAKYYISMKMYDRALEQLNKAGKYSSSPDIYIMKSFCYQKKNDYGNSIENLNLVKNMMPHHLFPNFLLMKVSCHFGKRKEALKYADEIICMPIKIKSSKAEDIIKEANLIKKEYEI